MTRFTKKVMTWLLSAFAFMALALGIAFGRPQTKTASAETVTATWSDSFGVQKFEDYTRYLIQTPELAWTSYNNVSYADEYLAYTKLNGRTVKEINETAAANGSTEKIWACLQPAGSYSFYSVCVPNTFEEMSPSEIRSFSIELGWTHVDSSTSTTYPGTGNTYTNSTTLLWHFRNATNEFKQNTGVNKDINATANFTLQNQGEVYSNNVATGSTCLILNTCDTTGLWTSGGTPLKIGNPVLHEIYINGKSIYDWNAEAQAAVAAGTATDILYGSTHAQNTSAGAPIAVLPSYANAAAHGAFFQFFIADNFLPASEIYSIKFTAGFSFMLPGSQDVYYMSEGVEFAKSGSSFVKVISTVDISDTITFSNGGTSEATDTYYIYTKGGQKWTAAYGSTGSTALGENEWKGQADESKQGGSVQMSFMYINGQSVYDINATDNEAYGSTHSNISSGMAKFAPIMAWVVPYNADLGGSAISIQIPTAYPGNKTTITIKKGFYVVDTSTNIKYEVTKDIQWDYADGAWGEHVEKIETNVTLATMFGSASDAFAGISLEDSDYAAAPSTYAGTAKTALSYAQSANFRSHILVDDVALPQPGEAFLNVWGNYGYFTFRTGNNTATKLTILAGCQFPTYDALLNGTKEVYVTTEDVTFIKDGSGNWVLDEGVTTYTVTVDGVAQTVEEGGYAVAPTETPTKAEDENYTYTFDNWYIVDTDMVFDFSTPITQDYNVESRFTANPKGKNVEVAWASGNFEPNIDNEAYTRIRLNTTGVAWTANVNNITTDQYLAYTKLNGRTVKEINEAATANGSAELITARLQKADGFSFYGLYIPNTFTEILAEDVYTVTIEAGWQHEDSGTGNTYTNSASITWYYRGDKTFQQNTGVNKDINETASFTFQNQGAQTDNDGNALNATCFILNTRNTTGLWTKYGNTIKVGNPVLNHIYINGKSIKEWNIEAQAAVDAATATDMLYGSTHGQNSNAGGPIAVLPGYANAEAHGAFFQIYIADNFLAAADIYSFEFKAGFSFMLSNSYDLYYMSEGVKFEKVNGSWVNANDLCTVTIEDYNGTVLDTQIVVKGSYATAVPNPSRPTTTTGIYTFTGWKDSDGNDFNFATTPITGDITIIAQYDEQAISIQETDVVSIEFQYNSSVNTWLIFELSNHDYTYDIANGIDTEGNRVTLEELRNIGFLDNIILKGNLLVGGVATEEATLAQIIDASQNNRETALINTWGTGLIGIRVPDLESYDSIQEIVIKTGTCFPSYEYACNDGETDTRFMVYIEKVFQAGISIQGVDEEGNKVNSGTTPFGATVSGYDISMADGAAIRITNLDNYDGSQNYMETEGYKKSGIRFQTWISKESLAQMQSYLADEIYTSVSFGTLIVPSADLVGGEFTHEWLDANSITYMDIASSAELTQGGWAFAAETNDYVTFFGSIVNLKSTNHNRYFSGVGYIAIVKKGETEPTYFYASYNQSSSRSASYIAQAAVADRSETETEYYDNKINENNNWSPYTEGEIAFLKLYMGTLTQTEAAAESFTLNSSGAFGWDTTGNKRNTGTLTVNKQLSGAYVQLNYQTNIDVWGKFYYQNAAGTASAVEDFYLPKGSSQHKQYLDLFRKNGVGTLAGLTANDLYLTKIEFQNATVDTSSSGTFKFLGLYSTARNLGTLLSDGTYGQEVYVTKSLDVGGEMTVGAHLGLGGALTYLAKSGIYEGATSKYYGMGSILLRQNTSEFVDTRNTNVWGTESEKGYYGHATSSKPGDGAVNLLNNYDAGRQAQQSWYANVGGSLSENTGANGYTRLDCDTGDGGYWPYNPVQAGDCESNPGQIIDYEVNEAKGYIYVKARAMDWAYGDTSKGGYTNGSTTKSYMENYYRLNADGTLYVNNSFIDWNGFTDMDKCDFCLVELPAFYPVQTLNHFFTYDGASPWMDGSLTHKDDLSAWTGGGNSHYQSTNDSSAEGKVGEEWVAWANDASGSVALGIYIPNVNRFLSGRTQTAVTASGNNINSSDNLLKSKGLISNMQAISYSYQSTYVQNTSYTAPGVIFRMEAYVPIEYTYVLAVNDITTIRSQFKAIHDSGKVTNASSQAGVKAGLDAWARQDKVWTQV